MAPTLQPYEFIDKWRRAELSERAAAQAHFIDLCHMLDEPTPAEADPKGEWYSFEKGTIKTGGGKGWADVWKRGHFAWEYKSPHKDLKAALLQLRQYAIALENPPLLVVCDLHRFCIHTHWTNTVSTVHEFELADLRDAQVRQKLKWVFSDPEKLRPDLTRQMLTEKAAAEFSKLALGLRDRGHPAETVARFINRLVFCMFAEDVDLLPNKLFERLLEQSRRKPDRFPAMASSLFEAMRAGGLIGFDDVAWFNGGLFEDTAALPLDRDDLALAHQVARLDWAEIDPSIFGTLFERGLDPDKRSQLGAHYTDRDKIMLIVEPVVIRPLVAEWETTKSEIALLQDKARDTAATPKARKAAGTQARSLYTGFLDRLRAFRVLDPACGSGNFLYLSLLALKDLECRAGVEAEVLGLPREFPQINPGAVLGIEVNPYAAELARVSVWIGEIQWMRRNGFDVSRDPILKPLETIACRDALLTGDGAMAPWPAADVVIGNPPFLGGKRLRATLGDDAVDRLFAAYAGRVPAEADLVCYWFARAWETMRGGTLKRAGLVATNSIRGGANRTVLEPLAQAGAIFDAWNDEPWILDGAAVRVSLVCFQAAEPGGITPCLNGTPGAPIHADLTQTGTNLTRAARLPENAGVAFMGDTKGGAFDIPGTLAREWLLLPLNPNGRPNSDVLRPWVNGMDIARRPADKWIIDFGWTMDEDEAALYEAPFAYVFSNVKPERDKNRRDAYRIRWWRHVEPRPGLMDALKGEERYIVTPRVARHRLFVWLDCIVCPDSATIVIAKGDDFTFGILHSRFHELWALGLCSWLGVGNDARYTPTTTFETFPFPEGLTPDLPAAAVAADPRAVKIAAAAKRLNELRDNWLNPADLVQRVPEVVPGYPDRLVPRDAAAERVLRRRTLTNLYNERPAFLDRAHRALDAAVAEAYGWPDKLGDEEVLARLFALNQERTGR